MLLKMCLLSALFLPNYSAMCLIYSKYLLLIYTFFTKKTHFIFFWILLVVITNLLLNDESVDEDENFALSAFILAVSLFFVSENWVAMTTRHRLIMKKEPTWTYEWYCVWHNSLHLSISPQWDTQSKSSSRMSEHPARNTSHQSNPPKRWRGIWPPKQDLCCQMILRHGKGL